MFLGINPRCSSTGFSLRMPCIPNGGCRGEGALNRKIANHRKRLPITRGSMLLLLLFLQVLGEDADEPLVIAPHVAYGESDQGVVCVLLHKGKHTAHGEVTLHCSAHRAEYPRIREFACSRAPPRAPTWPGVSS